MAEKNYSERLQSIERAIREAELEVGVRQKQLKELYPRREAMEKECQDKFGCSIKDLPVLQQKMESEFVRLVEELEQKLVEARNAG